MSQYVTVCVLAYMYVCSNIERQDERVPNHRFMTHENVCSCIKYYPALLLFGAPRNRWNSLVSFRAWLIRPHSVWALTAHWSWLIGAVPSYFGSKSQVAPATSFVVDHFRKTERRKRFNMPSWHWGYQEVDGPLWHWNDRRRYWYLRCYFNIFDIVLLTRSSQQKINTKPYPTDYQNSYA